MKPVVVREIDRAPADVVARLAAVGVATGHEAAGRTGLLGPRILARQDGMTIAGSAVTVLSHPGDNLMIHAAVEQCRPGDVLVIATTQDSVHGMVGDLLATSLRARGAVGLVTDAGVRDVAMLRRMGFAVWSRAVHAQGAVRATPGSVNVPVVVAGQRVRPGDVIVADDDGVLAVPASLAAEVADAAEARVANEDARRARFAAGELGLDMYDLRSQLERLGVEYVDRLPEGDPR